MKKKERLYDTISVEELATLTPLAEHVLIRLNQRMAQLRMQVGNLSSADRKTARLVSYLKFVQRLEEIDCKIPVVPKKPSFRSPEQIRRQEIIAELLDAVIPEEIQGVTYIDMCRKISSIMSMETWRGRRRKQEIKTKIEQARARLSVYKPRKNLEQRRQESWLVGARLEAKIRVQTTFDFSS
jgi:hypothetical protein